MTGPTRRGYIIACSRRMEIVTADITTFTTDGGNAPYRGTLAAC